MSGSSQSGMAITSRTRPKPTTISFRISESSRAAIDNAQNPRSVPGILARPGDAGAEVFPFHSDYDHPALFWITNG
jgi:hypothetical protein